MKAAPYGRFLLGASAVLFGVIALMWHDAETWQSMRSIWRLPLGTGVGTILMIAQIGGGIGLMFPRTMRVSSIILGVVYALFALSCVPGMIAKPANYAYYGSFFEQIALVCGAGAVYAATEPNAARAERVERATRIGLGLCAVSFALAQALYLRLTADLVPKWIPPNQMFWAVLTTGAFALAAIAMLINVRARLAAGLMALMVGFFGALVWIPLLVAHPETHENWSEFALTVLIAGASWVVAEVTPSFDKLRMTLVGSG